ncbi:MAG: hypothetical protein J7498_10060 [Sphingobium sp.]|nr:hypothetical protein [Sphingobium sp.]
MPADLFDDHRAIVAIAEDLLQLVRQTPRPGPAVLAEVRTRLGSRTAQHLRDEDAMIIRPLFGSGRIDELPKAQAAIAAIREARAHYSNHVGKWTLASIQSDWDGYADALVEMIRHLKQLIDHEERDLYWPALRLLGQDTQRA